jgi:hypothetical protein
MKHNKPPGDAFLQKGVAELPAPLAGRYDD